MKIKRSLYQCFNAKVMGGEIRCVAGHTLDSRNQNGNKPIRDLHAGRPLECQVCQECPDYDEMGPPILPEDRGWKE